MLIEAKGRKRKGPRFKRLITEDSIHMTEHPDIVWMTSNSYPPALLEDRTDASGREVAFFDAGTLRWSVVKCPGTREERERTRIFT